MKFVNKKGNLIKKSDQSSKKSVSNSIKSLDQTSDKTKTKNGRKSLLRSSGFGI